MRRVSKASIGRVWFVSERQAAAVCRQVSALYFFLFGLLSFYLVRLQIVVLI